MLPTLEQCVCALSVQRPVYLQSFHLIHSWPAGRKSLESLSPLPVFFPPLPLGGSKVIVFRYPCLFCGSVCQRDLGCCIRREIVDFSSSVLDQRPTISKAASLSQCLPNVCPCSGTENVDTVPKVPLQVPPPSAVTCYHTLRFKNIFHLLLRVCFFSFSLSFHISGKCVLLYSLTAVGDLQCTDYKQSIFFSKYQHTHALM